MKLRVSDVTHTHHRMLERELMKKDYIIMVVPAKGFNDKGSREKLKKAFTILCKNNPVNYCNGSTGSLLMGFDFETLREAIRDGAILHAVYKSKVDIENVIRKLKEENLGFSVVVSGLFDEMYEVARKVSIGKFHTVNLSLGVWGNKELLPESEILEITTMCGHGMISPNLVKYFLKRIAEGKISAEEAAKEIGKQCICGIFNWHCAAEKLKKMAGKLTKLKRNVHS